MKGFIDLGWEASGPAGMLIGGELFAAWEAQHGRGTEQSGQAR